MKRSSETYYRYKGFRGTRYFRISEDNKKAVQVCINSGYIKKGRGNSTGIFQVERLTIISNYFFCSDLKKCSKKEFDEAFKKVLKIIKYPQQ